MTPISMMLLSTAIEVIHMCHSEEESILLLYTRRDVVKTRHVAALSYP